LNRAVIGDIVFNDPEERKWLNSVIHPRVRKEIVKSVLKCWVRGEWAVVVDVPLLIEAGLWRWVGDIVVVYVYVQLRPLSSPLSKELSLTYRNEKLQLQRLLDRPSNPPLTQSQASSRISSQLPLSAKLNYATSVLDNSGTPKDLSQQVDRLVHKLKKQQGGESGWWWRICWLIPPVGLSAGLICLISRWWRFRGGERRRGRGEVEKRDARGENIELREMKRRNRGSESDSIYAE
jgi:dephospho-CoA kinase